jgi:hypothetical protein
VPIVRPSSSITSTNSEPGSWLMALFLKSE